MEFFEETQPRSVSNIENEVNYAFVDPKVKFEIFEDYFAPENPVLERARSLSPKRRVQYNSIKEGMAIHCCCILIILGTIKKKCGWFFYKDRKLVLTDYPKLLFYDTNKVLEV